MNGPFEIEEMLVRAATEIPGGVVWDCRGDDGLRARMEKSAVAP